MRKWSIGIGGDQKQGYLSGVITDKTVKDVLAKANLRILIGEYGCYRRALKDPEAVARYIRRYRLNNIMANHKNVGLPA